MGRKVSPTLYRLGLLKSWQSQWFNRKRYRQYLEADYKIREFIKKQASEAAIEKVEINRSRNSLDVFIHTGRPGLLIGRKGAEIKKIEQGLKRICRQFSPQGALPKLNLEIREVRDFETHARLVAAEVASQLERRIPFRRVIKQNLSKVMERPEVQGAKIEVAGRLDGQEMARKEWVQEGKLPLQTLRADVDYAQTEAHTKYGVVGVKVWIYKGERF